ncbi:TadE/TadG family type IV pilus assembly protein [Loktanella agnita]|uniref:TadE/TadG family type IV pilus assembly protein n=1 Tax=Loktanella agnita TaxID=287097 RepID=UPI0039863052
MKMISDLLIRFRNTEEGSISIELLLVVPILVWALMSTLVYFDIFRAEAISNRASLTIADMVSREEDPINYDYIDAVHELLQVLAEADNDPDIRVTYFAYDHDGESKVHSMIWSETAGGYSDGHDDASLQALSDQLPVMASNDRAFLVETRMKYRAPFEVGIGPFVTTNLDGHEFTNFTVIRPRFANVCFDYEDGNPPQCDPD